MILNISGKTFSSIESIQNYRVICVSYLSLRIARIRSARLNHLNAAMRLIPRPITARSPGRLPCGPHIPIVIGRNVTKWGAGAPFRPSRHLWLPSIGRLQDAIRRAAQNIDLWSPGTLRLPLRVCEVARSRLASSLTCPRASPIAIKYLFSLFSIICRSIPWLLRLLSVWSQSVSDFLNIFCSFEFAFVRTPTSIWTKLTTSRTGWASLWVLPAETRALAVSVCYVSQWVVNITAPRLVHSSTIGVETVCGASKASSAFVLFDLIPSAPRPIPRTQTAKSNIIILVVVLVVVIARWSASPYWW